MNPKYIIVQAGGRGSRMDYLTDNKPKALVPIGKKPMLFHLFDKFPDKEFIIIGDYKIDVLINYLDAFAKVKYLVVNAQGKKGTLSGIEAAINKIPDNESFMLIWSDLVLPESFSFPEAEDNYVGLSKGFECRWKYEDGIFDEERSSEFGVSGLFIFKDKSYLSDVPDSGEFVKWLKSKNMPFNTFGLYSTQEFGLIERWKKNSDAGLSERCRPFNEITDEGGVLIKRGIDKKGKELAVRERAWYRAASDLGYTHIPKIYEYNPIKMERIKGKNIYEYSDFTYEQRKDIVEKLVDNLKQLHRLNSIPTDYFSITKNYYLKTFERIDIIRNMIPFADERYVTVNGRKCKNIYFYKKELYNRIQKYVCKKFEFIHGDCTFSNMMLDENYNPILIDPRGYYGYTELFGDPSYDWAKIYYSIVGNYDQFNLKRFKLTVNDNSVKVDVQSNGWEDVADYYLSLISDEVSTEDIKLIHAIIWISLTTYAWEDYDSICSAFYLGLYYLEEVL